MRKYDKSLIEVWEWKEKVYQDVKDLTAKEYIEKIKSDAEKILVESRVKLKAISLREEKQKVA
jgi:nitrogen-specific signal transduction histidine kinase